MVQVVITATMRGGVQTGVRPVHQSGDIVSPDVWIGVLGAVGCNDDGSGDNLFGVPIPYNIEAGKVAG